MILLQIPFLFTTDNNQSLNLTHKTLPLKHTQIPPTNNLPNSIPQNLLHPPSAHSSLPHQLPQNTPHNIPKNNN